MFRFSTYQPHDNIRSHDNMEFSGHGFKSPSGQHNGVIYEILTICCRDMDI